MDLCEKMFAVDIPTVARNMGMSVISSELKRNKVEWKEFPKPHLKVYFFAEMLKLKIDEEADPLDA